MDEYDITAAFQAIEDELIASMIRNMSRHRAEETAEGIEWSMWQAEQLKSLEKYKQENQKKYSKQFKSINGQAGALIKQARIEGNMQQEISILNAIKNGFKGAKRMSPGATAEFFKLNDRKLEALVKATTDDMKKAETAVLRMANDQYRKVIYNAQVYANTGAGTYEKAVDMATRDFLAAGLNCVEYKNGARHTLSDYADMAIRTASKRAYLQGEGEKRQEWGIATVIVNKRGNPCPLCLPFVGKILIDDVWSGGSKDNGKYPLMSTAIAAGLYHPRCRDSHTTYFPGVSTADDKWSKKELEAVDRSNKQEAKEQYVERQTEKYERLAEYSLDSENQNMYQRKADQWRKVRFKTGGIDSQGYYEQKRELVIRTKANITESWLESHKGRSGALRSASSITVKDIEYKVDGKYVVLDAKAQEIHIAKVLSESYGCQVEILPRVASPKGISTPDYIIDGKKFDLKSPTGNGKNVLYGMVSKKRRQASNFIFDLSNSPLGAEEIERQINDIYSSNHTLFIDKIVVLKNDKIVNVYERHK